MQEPSFDFSLSSESVSLCFSGEFASRFPPLRNCITGTHAQLSKLEHNKSLARESLSVVTLSQCSPNASDRQKALCIHRLCVWSAALFRRVSLTHRNLMRRPFRIVFSNSKRTGPTDALYLLYVHSPLSSGEHCRRVRGNQTPALITMLPLQLCAFVKAA